MRRVAVKIDRLILRGVRLPDRHAVAAGLQEELSRLLAVPEAGERIAQIGNLHRVVVGTLQVSGGPIRAGEVGIAAARGIVRRLLP